VLALAVITLLGFRFSATVREHAASFAMVALAAGAALCGSRSATSARSGRSIIRAPICSRRRPCR